MESILCVNIPVQMISCTDTNGKITPIRFRFRDKSGEIITVTVEEILSEDQDRNRIAANYTCSASIYGTKKIEEHAFEKCINLEEVICPKSLKKISHGAFAGCVKLTKVEYGSDVEVDEGAFSGCLSYKG